jgi:predicted transcriptional regulator
MGAGRGYGRGYGWNPTAAGKIVPTESADEMEMLKAEADYMKNSLETINKRIRSLEKKPVEKS